MMIILKNVSQNNELISMTGKKEREREKGEERGEKRNFNENKAFDFLFTSRFGLENEGKTSGFFR